MYSRIGGKETKILPLIDSSRRRALAQADEWIVNLQTTLPCECTWWCCDVPSSRSSPYHGRCLRRNYPRNDGFKSGKSLSTGPSESPAPGSRLQESGGKDDDLSWWSWLKKKGRRTEMFSRKLYIERGMRNLLRADRGDLGRGPLRSELWRSAAKLDSQHARIHRTSSYNDRFFARPSNQQRQQQLHSAILDIPSDYHYPDHYFDTRLRASPFDNAHSEVSTPPAHISLARSLSTLRSCPIKSTHTSTPPRPMAQKDDNSPSSLWTRRSK